MIKHVVLFNIKAGTSQKQIDAMVAGYDSMKDVVPELLSWSMGPTCAPTGEFAHAMVAVVENMETLQRYVDHPLHKQVAAELGRPIFEKRVIADYEFDPEAEPWEPQIKEVWTKIVDVVRPKHTVLLVIDVQNDFCAPNGARMKGDLTTIEAMKKPSSEWWRLRGGLVCPSSIRRPRPMRNTTMGRSCHAASGLGSAEQSTPFRGPGAGRSAISRATSRGSVNTEMASQRFHQSEDGRHVAKPGRQNVIVHRRRHRRLCGGQCARRFRARLLHRGVRRLRRCLRFRTSALLA